MFAKWRLYIYRWITLYVLCNISDKQNSVTIVVYFVISTVLVH